MPSLMNHGQSGSTEIKERGFAAALTVNLRIFQGRFGEDPRYRYFHFDMNSGNGFNYLAGCIGSPLAFCEAVERVGCERYFAAFVDRDKKAIEGLLERPHMDDERRWAFNGKNAELLACIPDIIRHFNEDPEYALGSILFDPNGTDIPIPEIAKLAKICRRLDVFINVNSTQFKRGSRVSITVEDIKNSIDKKYWLIREPIGKQLWTILIGRNYPGGAHEAIGFYKLESAKGQAILLRCNLTKYQLDKRARLAQRKLFEADETPTGIPRIPPALAVSDRPKTGNE